MKKLVVFLGSQEIIFLPTNISLVETLSLCLLFNVVLGPA